MNGNTIASGPFEPTFESLRQFECPEWFRDAKLGIWSHWGAQSVPMYGDWYARNMYIEGSEQYRYHVRQYGHPSKFGYKDLVQLWKAEAFDPDALMDLYTAAGAKYFVAQAMHHDNFFNYDSDIHQWNSVNMGPRKDIVAMWKEAAVRRGLPFGLTEHLGATFSWFHWNKGRDKEGPYAGIPYDGSDPAFEDLYLPNSEKTDLTEPWYTSNPWWHRHWLSVMKEIIDKYQPDLLYSDGGLPFADTWLGTQKTFVDAPDYKAGLLAVAHLYNTSAAIHGGANRAVYNQKDRRKDVYTIGVLDIERSQEPEIKPEAWQTDTCVGEWFYNVKTVYKKPEHVIEILVDIVSKNGNLLLNIPQRPDGTIDDECKHILREMADWIRICGEGIYGTRPFRVSGEGLSQVVIDHFTENAVNWSRDDYRFTQKGNILYAFQMRWPEDHIAVIRTLTAADKVKSVRLLGMGEVPFEQPYGALIVSLPACRPSKFVNCLAIELEP
ncbi:alpha-L-fucosidase [Paenibacillus sp. GCM10023248]|uniref:alpha-L-fucosidase n=1 Tax=unclassified Paenibacillus TaxID=185978 RepID=UPI002378AB47|nr:alpha-L-fucosidase [Paenibacillus sp. MAHUQ-63]MDD9267145.1 alpha-L-fucosidase [Paenibacillus sp. MAHUQ-63]